MSTDSKTWSMFSSSSGNIDSNELGPQLIQTKPIFHVFLDPLISNLLGPWSCTSSSHVCQDSKGANFVIGELHSMNDKVDFNSHYPFIELRGISIINSWFGNKDNLSCVGGRDGGHSSGRWGENSNRFWILSTNKSSLSAKGEFINNYSELSSDLLMIQSKHSPLSTVSVRIYSRELFKKSGICESGKFSVEAMWGPLFSMMKCLHASTVLLNGEIIEMMGVEAET